MTFSFIYEPFDYPRIIFGVMVDARAGTPLANQIGDIIKGYVDTEIAKVTDEVLFYKIEGNSGELCGYFSLLIENMGQKATQLQFLLRPNYQQFSNDINSELITFIQTGGWQADLI